MGQQQEAVAEESAEVTLVQQGREAQQALHETAWPGADEPG